MNAMLEGVTVTGRDGKVKASAPRFRWPSDAFGHGASMCKLSEGHQSGAGVSTAMLSARHVIDITLARYCCAPGARRFDTSSSQSLTCKRTLLLKHEAQSPKPSALRTCFVTRPCSRRRPTTPASICRVSRVATVRAVVLVAASMALVARPGLRWSSSLTNCSRLSSGLSLHDYVTTYYMLLMPGTWQGPGCSCTNRRRGHQEVNGAERPGPWPRR